MSPDLHICKLLLQGGDWNGEGRGGHGVGGEKGE